MPTLADRVLSLDYTVILAVRQAGPAAEGELSPLARHAEAGVRELALYCLAETGGPLALGAFAGALLDHDAVVRAAAMRSLLRHTASVSAPVAHVILVAYDRSDDPVVRGAAAIIVGRSPAGAGKAAELAARWKQEPAPEAQEGLVVALAGLGDQDAANAFVALLHGARGRDRARLLDHAFTLHAPWLLKPLAPILDDLSPVLRIGADGDPTVPEHLRAADLAVALVASISGHAFSFPVDRQTNFTPEQIDEVRAFVARLP